MKHIFTLTLLLLALSSPQIYAQAGLDHVLKAEEFKRSKNYDAALAEYDKAIKAEPKNAEYMYRKGQLYFIKRDAENAIQYFEKTINLRQDYLNAYVGLARLYTIKENNDNAIKAFENAYKYEDNKAKKLEYKTNIIKILYKLRRYEQAKTHLQDVLVLEPDNISLLYFNAVVNNNLGDYEIAKTNMLKATAILKSDDPKEFAKYYYELGYAYYHLEKYPEARLALDKANYGNLKPLVFKMTPPYFYGMAFAYYKVYDIEESKKYIDVALKMKPDFSQANDLQLKISNHKTDKSTVLASLKKAADFEKDPIKKANAYGNLAEGLFYASKFQEALTAVNAGLAIQAQNGQMLLLKAMTLFKLKKSDEAIAILSNLVKQPALEQEARAQYNFALGLIYSRSGKDAKIAENTLRKADFAGYKFAAMAEIESLNGQKADDQPKMDTDIKIEGDN
ncbi:MAG: tetratricopeptide repeat protein [Thermoflexibacter sp.]|jgi:tetratricopeptide (TPR) repeat protein|nr:tetratricopeptide repeat protein [Thermoflexibacter sp.]